MQRKCGKDNVERGGGANQVRDLAIVAADVRHAIAIGVEAHSCEIEHRL